MTILIGKSRHDEQKQGLRTNKIKTNAFSFYICACLMQWEKTSLQEVLASITRPVKSGTASPTTRYRCDVLSELCCPSAKPRIWTPPPAFTCCRRYSENLNFFMLANLDDVYDVQKANAKIHRIASSARGDQRNLKDYKCC